MSTRIISDGFEAGTLNTSLWSDVPNQISSGGLPIVVTAGSGGAPTIRSGGSGSKLCYMNWGTYYNMWIGTNISAYNLSEIYLSYYIYYKSPFAWDADFTGENGNNKHARFFGTGQLASQGHGGGHAYDLLRSSIVVAKQRFGDNVWIEDWGSGATPTIEVWHKWEFYEKLNTVGQSNGIARCWLNGSSLADFTNCSLRSNSSLFADLAFPGNNRAQGADSPFYIDDVEVWDGMPSTNSPPVGTPVLSVR